jgi:hypothetical protein
MTYGWKALEVQFLMVHIPSRLEFPTESYDDFSGHESAERLLFRILFLLYVFIINFKSHV